MDAVGCDWLISELGPPPDAILRIPPPPLPHFIDRIYHEMAAASAHVGDSQQHKANETALPCHWCHWARRLDSVGSISVTSGTEMAMEDTWFFVILASCLMLTLGALLAGLIYLRLQGRTLKGTWEFGSFLTESGSSGGVLPSIGDHDDNVIRSIRTANPADVNKSMDGGSDRCASADSAIRAANFLHQPNGIPAAPMSQPTRALWAAVKTSEGNHYTITHAQPVDQKLLLRMPPHPPMDQADEDSAGYTTLHPNAAIASNTAKIYYCCTDLMIVQQQSAQKVTSLDDPDGCDSESGSRNPTYVNMSALHPLSTPKAHYPLVNPIYPSPYHPSNRNQPINHTIRQQTHQA